MTNDLIVLQSRSNHFIIKIVIDVVVIALIYCYCYCCYSTVVATMVIRSPSKYRQAYNFYFHP